MFSLSVCDFGRKVRREKKNYKYNKSPSPSPTPGLAASFRSSLPPANQVPHSYIAHHQLPLKTCTNPNPLAARTSPVFTAHSLFYFIDSINPFIITHSFKKKAGTLWVKLKLTPDLAQQIADRLQEPNWLVGDCCVGLGDSVGRIAKADTRILNFVF